MVIETPAREYYNLLPVGMEKMGVDFLVAGSVGAWPRDLLVFE